jgi:hypothetical protein
MNETSSNQTKIDNIFQVPPLNDAPIVVPFTEFLPVINEIGNIYDEAIDLVEAAEHNKRTCAILKKRIFAANIAALYLKFQGDKEDRNDFFNSKNYLCLQNLSNIITRIKEFIAEISQMKTLLKYIKAKKFERTFREFDDYVNVLTFFSIKIADELIQSETDELKQLKEVQDDLAEMNVYQVKQSINNLILLNLI